MTEMLSYMKYCGRANCLTKYIYPFLDVEIIQMTIPDKPNS